MILELINTTGFQTFITFIVGLSAYVVYKSQQRQYKKDAANTILLEIQNAERSINKIEDVVRGGSLDTELSVMPSESWSKYKYLFVRDFDRDEWDLLTDFYDKASLLDQAIKYSGTAFANDVEQIRANKQRVLAEYAKEIIEEFDGNNSEELTNRYKAKSNLFDALYMDRQGEFAYRPQKPIDDAKLYLGDIEKHITTSTVGVKLKKIARRRNT